MFTFVHKRWHVLQKQTKDMKTFTFTTVHHLKDSTVRCCVHSGDYVWIVVSVVTILGRVVEINRLHVEVFFAKSLTSFICLVNCRRKSVICECESHALVVCLMTRGCN